MGITFGEIILNVCPAKSPIETIACTSDSQKLIVGQVATDKPTPTLSIVDINTGNMEKIIETTDNFDNTVWQLVIDKNDNYVVYQKQKKSDFQIIKYNLTTGEKDMVMETKKYNQFNSLVISSQNELVIARDNNISFIDLQKDKIIKELQIEESKTIRHPDCYTSLAFSPDGKVMAIGGLKEGEVLLYDPQKEIIINRLSEKFKFPSRIVFDPTGNYLFILDYWAEGMFIWNLQTSNWYMENIFGEKYCYITCIDFNKQNPQNLVTGSLYSEVEVINFETNEKLFSDAIHKARVYNVLFTPDCKKLISSGEDWHIIIRNAE